MNKISKILSTILLVIILSSLFQAPPAKAQTEDITADQLITLINNWRVGYGHAPLEVDPILMTTAYDTACYMAINGLRWHIGDVSDRIAAYGYGGGAKVFATENFAIGPVSLATIAEWWSDEAHQYPSANPSYVHIGAGVCPYGDRIWYIVHAAYTSGTYVASTPDATQSLYTSTPAVSQLIVPVQTVTPNENGAVVHEVLPGQALWSIAIAYDTKIDELIRLNNLDPETPTIYVGDKILVFEANRTPSATIDATKTTPTQSTLTPTKSPTRTKTATPRSTRTPTFVAATPEPTELASGNQNNSQVNTSAIFQNQTVGIILISTLGLGILLIIFSSFGKDPAPKEIPKEGDE
jgi:LysM repeat protein